MTSEINKIYIRKYDSPCGRLILGATGDSLCMCDWDMPDRRRRIDRALCVFFNAEMVCGENYLLNEAERELDEYFAGQRKVFDIPVVLAAKGLRADVWNSLLEIGYGMTATYSDIAARAGRPKAVRAVASAIGANPISIFIPCHRVIGKSGALTGYAGGLDAKRLLLDLERD